MTASCTLLSQILLKSDMTHCYVDPTLTLTLTLHQGGKRYEGCDNFFPVIFCLAYYNLLFFSLFIICNILVGYLS